MDIKAAQQVLIKLESKYRYIGPKATGRAYLEFTSEDQEAYHAAHAVFNRNAEEISHEAY